MVASNTSSLITGHHTHLPSLLPIIAWSSGTVLKLLADKKYCSVNLWPLVGISCEYSHLLPDPFVRAETPSSYGTAGIPRSKLQSLNERIVTKLLGWKAQLPSSLQIDLNDHTSQYLPHVLLLQ